MGRKKKNPVPDAGNEDSISSNVAMADEQPIEPFRPVESGPGPKVKPRLSFNLTDDGMLDPDVRADTLSKVKAFFNDPRNRELLGDAAVEDLISDEDIAGILAVIGTLEGFAFSKMGGIDPDIAMTCFHWQKPQVDAVTPMAKRVLIKYAEPGGWYLRWKDEIGLGMIMLAITRAQFETAKRAQLKRNELRNRAASAVPEPAANSAVNPDANDVEVGVGA